MILPNHLQSNLLFVCFLLRYLTFLLHSCLQLCRQLSLLGILQALCAWSMGLKILVWIDLHLRHWLLLVQQSSQILFFGLQISDADRALFRLEIIYQQMKVLHLLFDDNGTISCSTLFITGLLLRFVGENIYWGFKALSILFIGCN